MPILASGDSLSASGGEMKMRSWRGFLAIGAVLIAPLAASATPVVYTITTDGLDGAHICTNVAGNCTGTKTFQYAPPVSNGLDPATGTITLDSSAGTVAFNISVASATFLAIGDVADNGVDEIEFTTLNYTGTLTGVSFTPSGPNTTISWTAQTIATVTGSYEQLLNGGNVNGPDAFSKPARMNAGGCTLTSFGNLTCGFILGPGGPFDLSVGPDATPVTRRVVHTLNVAAVPEPSTAILMALGVAAIGLRRRMH